MKDIPEVGSMVSIVSYKHDGSFHRSWGKSTVLSSSREKVIVANKRIKVSESNGRKWYTSEPAVVAFYFNKWFNIISMIKKGGVTYYVNIASPALYEDGKIKYIDYDLDVKLFPDGSTKILDKNEFKKHITKYGYSDKLASIIREEVDVVLEQMENEKLLFEGEQIEKYLDRWYEMDENKG